VPAADRGVLTSPVVRILPGLAVALGACGGTAPASPLANTGATISLRFSELRLYIGPLLVEKLHRDGTIEMDVRARGWEPFGRIDASGAAFRADGQKLGDLASDGTFRLPTGEASSWKLVGEALVLEGGTDPELRRTPIQLTIDAKGELRGFADPGPRYRFEGLTDAASRHAALFMYAIVLTGRY
jgi:hypothetical protein